MLLLPVLLPPLLVTAGSLPPGLRTDGREEAGRLFRSSCAACHLPPDPDVPTDRAWLAQVADTA